MGDLSVEARAVLDAVKYVIALKDLHGTHVPWQICRAWDAYERSLKAERDVSESDTAKRHQETIMACRAWLLRCPLSVEAGRCVGIGDAIQEDALSAARDALVEAVDSYYGTPSTVEAKKYFSDIGTKWLAYRRAKGGE